jgi:hypothetical protein
MIMLMGLVAKNAILLVDYTNTLRRRGESRYEALVEAGPTRLRPILMTTMVLVFAMIPLALKLGDGAESRSPMAIVVLGGMITSTMLTLILVPCVYTYLDDFQNLLMRRRVGSKPKLAIETSAAAPPVMAGASEDEPAQVFHAETVCAPACARRASSSLPMAPLTPVNRQRWMRGRSGPVRVSHRSQKRAACSGRITSCCWSPGSR